MIMSTGYSEHTQSHDSRIFVARDPRFLILAFCLIVIFTFIIPDVMGLVMTLLYVVVLHRAVGLSLGTLAKNAKNISGFVLLIIVVNAALVRGEPLTSLVPFLSKEGVYGGVFYSIRLLVLYFAVTVFLATTSPEGIASGLAALIRPFSARLAHRAAFFGFLSIGYLPLFAGEISRIQTAQRFRGGGLDGGPIRKLNGARLLLVPLFLSAIHRSAQLAMVVELRKIKSTIIPLLRLERASRNDYGFVLLTLVVLIIAWKIT
ncbi:MAG: energy-coupling factor transporter transmembrane protein EcfT [Candidatus Latescibacterota bacterium]|nr:MAG: energy-coupling factor transporter transmembrane protein EcfT [Candidatus Latescibacterota bacterium]